MRGLAVTTIADWWMKIIACLTAASLNLNAYHGRHVDRRDRAVRYRD